MRNLLIALVFIVWMIPTLAQEDEENTPLMRDLTGLTAPQVEALLNEQGLLLDPIIQSLDASVVNGQLNTVGEQSIETGESVEPGTVISISVIRDFNVLLIYYNKSLERQGIQTDHFTMINLSEEDLYIDGIVFQSDGKQFVASDWRASSIKANECFQLWSNPNNGNHLPPECGTLAGVGIMRDTTADQQFWKETDSFTVTQDGVYRGTCDVAEGRCKLWVSPSPQMIAEDVTEYAYFVYDEHELVVFNSSEAQWMPLYQIQLDDLPDSLNMLRLWSSSRFDNLDFLAPNQCVVFTDGSRKEPLVDCFSIAQKNYNDALFWSDGFSVKSLYKDGIERNCPAPSGKTFCLIPRYGLNR